LFIREHSSFLKKALLIPVNKILSSLFCNSSLCKVSGISKQTVNSALRKLEAEGIIYLENAGAKNKSVCLTIKGKKLADRTVRRIIDIENEEPIYIHPQES